MSIGNGGSRKHLGQGLLSTKFLSQTAAKPGWFLNAHGSFCSLLIFVWSHADSCPLDYCHDVEGSKSVRELGRAWKKASRPRRGSFHPESEESRFQYQLFHIQRWPWAPWMALRPSVSGFNNTWDFHQASMRWHTWTHVTWLGIVWLKLGPDDQVPTHSILR